MNAIPASPFSMPVKALEQGPSPVEMSKELKQSPSSITKSAEELKEWPISAAAPLEEFRTRLEKTMRAYFSTIPSTIPAAEKTVTIRNVQEDERKHFHLLRLAEDSNEWPTPIRRVVIEQTKQTNRYSITESIPYNEDVPTSLFFKPGYFDKTTPAKMFGKSDKHKSDLSYILTEIDIGNAGDNYDLIKIKRCVKDDKVVKKELVRQNQAERLYLEPKGLFRANNDEKSFVNSLKGALKTAFKRYGFKETPEVTLKHPTPINSDVEKLDLEKVCRTFYVEEDLKNKYTYNVAVDYQREEPDFYYILGTTVIRIKGNSQKEYKIINRFPSNGLRENLKKIPAEFFPKEEDKLQLKAKIAKRKAEIAKRKAEIAEMQAQIEEFNKEINAIQENQIPFDDSKSSEEKDS